MDSFTAEKYFGVPDSVERRMIYQRNSVLHRTDLEGLASKELLLIHGSDDRKVLLQHSLLFSQKLVEQNIIFQQQVRLVSKQRGFLVSNILAETFRPRTFFIETFRPLFIRTKNILYRNIPTTIHTDQEHSL